MIATQFKDIKKTRQTRVLYIFSIIVIGALFLVLLLHFGKDKGYDAVLRTASIEIPVTVADTEKEIEQGLSGTLSLPQNTGKLFVFKTPGRYGFWMKDMNYGLDLIWLDKDLRVVDISKGVLPETYPKVFYPKEDVSYVLEIDAGFSTKHDLKENQLMSISNKSSF